MINIYFYTHFFTTLQTKVPVYNIYYDFKPADCGDPVILYFK